MMVIKELHIDNFGKFHQCVLEFGPGINILYGENEAGKSTIYTFIKAMLFGVERLRGRGAGKDEYTHYKPWYQGKNYDGMMIFEYKNTVYRLTRSFYKEDEGFSLIKESTGEIVVLPEDKGISALIPGLTEANFKNIISFGQFDGAFDPSFGMDVHTYLGNVSQTKNQNVNLNKTMAALKQMKKMQQSQKPEQEIRNLMQQISALEDNSQWRQQKEGQLQAIVNEKEALEKDCIRLKDEIGKIQKADRIQRREAIRLIEENNQITKAYREKKKAYEEARKSKGSSQFKTALSDIKIYENLIRQKADADNTYEEARESYDVLKTRNMAITLSVFLAAFLISTAVLLWGEVLWKKMLIAGICIIVVVVVGRFFNNKTQKAKNDLKKLEAEGVSKSIDLQMREILSRYHVDDFEKLKRRIYVSMDAADNTSRLESELLSLKKRYDLLQEPLKPYIDKYGEDVSLEFDAADSEIAKLHDHEEKIEELSRREDKLLWEMEAEDAKTVEKVTMQEHLDELQMTAKACEEEIRVLGLCEETINEISKEVHQDFGQLLNENVTEAMKYVTGDTQRDIKIDSHFQVMADNGHDFVGAGWLSSGTKDQVYFIIRQCMGRLIFEDQMMPVILDDSFAMYDETRLKQMLIWLNETIKSQIIIFTCHNREADLLDSIGLDYNYIYL